MKRSFFVTLSVSLVLLSACRNDEPYREIPPGVDDFVGQHITFSLNEETRDLRVDREITCYFKTPEGAIIKREGTLHRRMEGVSTFTMEQGLKEGEYMLLRLEYLTHDPATGRQVVDNFGVGQTLNLKDGSVSVTGTYASAVKLCGSGTAEDPYIVSAPSHLSTMRKIINDEYERENLDEGAWFRQECDIDMASESYKCDSRWGWNSIGSTMTTPFSYNYDGGNYRITGLVMKRDESGGVGLFGYIDDAIIQNVRIEGANITGLHGVGAVAGVVVASGKGRSESIIRNCRVSGTTITTPIMGVGIGGILGAVDMNTQVWIDGCDVSDSRVSGSYGVGGVLGGGYILSKSIVTNCRNTSTDIVAQYTGAGGIVGSADTLLVTSCVNTGRITGSLDNAQKAATNGYYGVGGIAGSSGQSAFYACSNEGTVNGVRGVGGILGTTLVSDQGGQQGALYNFTFFSNCANSGNITGDQFIGGICGEGQVGCWGSSNKGTITGTGNASYAGGIVGAATVCAIHNTFNSGDILGKSYCGGIIARATYGTLAINNNFGRVFGGDQYVAGIAGLVGSSSVVHYCSNWGPISAGRGGYVSTGGIVGAIGEPRHFSLGDVATCVFATVEIAASVLLPVCGFATETMRTLSTIVSLADFGINAVLTLIDAGSTGFTLFSQLKDGFGPTIEPIKALISADMAQSSYKFDRELAALFRAVETDIPHFLNYGCINDTYRANHQQLVKWYEDSGGDYFNDMINLKRDERVEQIVRVKTAVGMVQNLISGGLLVCSTALLVTTATAAILTTAGAAIPVAITAGLALEGIILSVVGGANAVWGICSDFVANACIVSQCVNGGTLLAPVGGGIVGHLEQGCKINDCLNLGGSVMSERGTRGALAGDTGLRSDVDHSVNLNWKWDTAIVDVDTIFKPDVHYNYSVHLEHDPFMGRVHWLEEADVPHQSAYPHLDFDKRWEIPSLNVTRVFPIPRISEMSNM